MCVPESSRLRGSRRFSRKSFINPH
jgi:hypothetical protein